MNYLQILAFFGYVGLVFVAGVGVFTFLRQKDAMMEDRSLYLGEIFLLGNVVAVGQLVTLSLTGLYRGLNLWAVIALNLLFLLSVDVRKRIAEFVHKKPTVDLPVLLFGLFLIFFAFRNCLPLIDVDSHSTYLWMPKLWLMHGTSIFGNISTDVRAFLPHLESVPYGLGMVLFGQETLFAGLINLFWRVIVLLSVFGYTRYRFNGYFGLAAALLVMLNEHFFYSGTNFPVLLNGAVIAFVFAVVYNLWESRQQGSPFRFLLALIFLSQIIAVKFQMALVIILLFGFMLVFQKDLKGTIKEILAHKNWVLVFGIAVYCAAFWLIKNFLATGLPTYPVLAGKFNVLGWTPESSRAYLAVMGGIDFNLFLKYMNYIFIWPGIHPTKILIVIISFLPMVLLFSSLKGRWNERDTVELSYWLAVTILIVMGISLTCHQDPRYYRYGIAVAAFAAVFGINYIFNTCLFIRNRAVIGGILILCSLVPLKIMTLEGTGFNYPTLKENLAVLQNRLYTAELIDQYYPKNKMLLDGYNANLDKISSAAWDARDPVITSAFVLPELPHVGLWFTAVIAWDSYEQEALIVQDLKSNGIEWIFRVKTDSKEVEIKSAEDFAQEAVTFKRYPKQTYFNYGFPAELSATNL